MVSDPRYQRTAMVLYEGLYHLNQLRGGLPFTKDNLRMSTPALPVQI